MRVGSVHIGAPLSIFPPVERAAAVVLVCDRRNKFGRQVLTKLLGKGSVRDALAQRSKWIIGIRTMVARELICVNSEQELLEFHTELLDTVGRARGAGHIEVYHLVEPPIRERLNQHSALEALRVVPVGGQA